MALDYTVSFLGQVDPGDPNYPLGKAQDIVVEGDKTGTPFRADFVNDIWGFLQAILSASAITASGFVDNANVSQYLDGLGIIFDANNAKRKGVKGNGTTDDVVKINAAIAGLGAAGGGEMFFPPGRYRHTAALLMHPKVSLRGVPGQTIFALDDATASAIDFGAVAYTGPISIKGISFEANQANTGTIFDVTVAGDVQAHFTECTVNKFDDKLRGLLTGSLGLAFTFDDCDMTSRNATGTAWASPFEITLSRGRWVMDPAAVKPLLGPSGSNNAHTIAGTRFEQISTVGGLAFIGATLGSTKCALATFNVDDSGAGDTTFAFEIGGGVLVAENNLFEGAGNYLRTGMAAVGSRLQLPDISVTDGSSAFVQTDPARVLYLDSTNASNPTVQILDPICPDQEFDLCVRNVHGSGSWSGAVAVSGHTVPFLSDPTAGPHLTDNDAVLYRFRAIIDSFSIQRWIQVCPTLHLH